MARRDLVGAIMRVTGGRGLSPRIALDLIGEQANRAGRLRGLFVTGGTEDLDDLATLLRVEEGFDVRDDHHLAELIRQVADGGQILSMEDTETFAAEQQEKDYRIHIRQLADKLNRRLPPEAKIRTVGRKFAEVEARVLAEQESRRARVMRRIEERVRRLGESARRTYEEAIAWARNVLPAESFETLVEEELVRIPFDDPVAYYRRATAIIEARTLDYINGEIDDAIRAESERFEQDPGIEGIEGSEGGTRTEGFPEPAAGGSEGYPAEIGRAHV